MRSLTLVIALLVPAAAFGQRGSDAGLVGTIRDGSGAVMAAATVTVSSPQLIGGSQIAIADQNGTYRFLFLLPGTYEIVAVRSGFKPARRSRIELLPGLTFTIDFRMEIAEVNEAVLVDATPPIVDVRTSSSPVLIDRTLIENLPLSRTAFDTVNLAPGVIRNVAFGGTVGSNPFMLDGANGNESSWGTPTIHPNVNWIEELQVVSVGADARYGEFTGAQTNAITRSGSNRFSGFGDYWTTRPTWTGNNRGSLTADLRQRFRPIEVITRWDVDAQLGGPVAKDRLWFFAGAERYRDVKRPVSFANVPRTSDEPRNSSDEQKFIGKLTVALSPSMRADGHYARTTLDVSGANASPLVQPEALSVSSRREAMWNARLLWTLSSRTFLEVRHGGYDATAYSGPPADRRSGPPGHLDQVTSVTSVNAYFFQDFASKPLTTGAHLTYFASGRGPQTHDLRMGFEFEHARLLQADGYVGGMVFEDSAGQPDLVVIWNGATYRPRHNRNTIYAQDAWNVTNRLTLNVGIRAGLYGGSVPGHEDAFSSHSVSPRLGAAWDLTNDHRTVLRVHYGRNHDEMVTSFYDFLDPLSQTPEITAAVVGPNQYAELSRSATTSSASIDPSVKYSFVEEVFAGVERQLPFGIAAKVQYIRRDFKDSIGFIDAGSVWRPFQVVDPGPDGTLGTTDDGGQITLFENADPTNRNLVLTNPNAYRRYRGIQAVATKRYSQNLDFQASYTWSRTVGNYNNLAFSNAANNDLGAGGVFVNPNLAINAEGRTPQDFTHEFKIVGVHRLPAWGGLNVAGVYRFQSGRPWARTIGDFRSRTQANLINVEPRGTRELGAVNQLDLRLEKTWRPGLEAATIGAFVDVFNVGNQGVALTINNRSGLNFGVPTSWTEARTIRAGVRLTF